MISDITQLQLLQNSNSITSINLFIEHIQDEDIKLLIGAIKVNLSLTELNLYYTNINNRYIKALSDALKVNSTLIELN